jgi:hypothetical protein
VGAILARFESDEHARLGSRRASDPNPASEEKAPAPGWNVFDVPPIG